MEWEMMLLIMGAVIFLLLSVSWVVDRFEDAADRATVRKRLRRFACDDDECWLHDHCDEECLYSFKVGGTDA